MFGTASMLLRLGGAVAAGAVVAAAAGCSSGDVVVGAGFFACFLGFLGPGFCRLVACRFFGRFVGPVFRGGGVAAGHRGGGVRLAGGGGPAGCATRDLQAKAGVAQGAAGSLYQVIDFTNISNVTCTLYGYPGVSLAAGTPVTQVGQAASRSTVAGPALVTLAPGQTANALLRITQALNYPTGTCAPTKTTYLQIYPPNETTPIYLAYSVDGVLVELGEPADDRRGAGGRRE